MLTARESYPTDAVDFSKYPLERIFYLLAGVIPGLTALLVFELAVPGSFAWLFSLSFLGYKVKLSLVVLVAFVIGVTMSILLNGLLYAIGATIADATSKEPYKDPASYEIAPWRDPRWRFALKKRLGEQSPNDTVLLGEGVVKVRQDVIGLLPANEREEANRKLNLEKLSLEIDDGKWAQWYDFYHQAINKRYMQDFHWSVRRGLDINLEVAAIYILVSALFVSKLRHWWFIVPSVIWIVILVAEQRTDFTRYANKWSTLDAQVEYLSEGIGADTKT